MKMRTREIESTLQVKSWLCMDSERGQGGITDRAGIWETVWGR